MWTSEAYTVLQHLVNRLQISFLVCFLKQTLGSFLPQIKSLPFSSQTGGWYAWSVAGRDKCALPTAWCCSDPTTAQPQQAHQHTLVPQPCQDLLGLSSRLTWRHSFWAEQRKPSSFLPARLLRSFGFFFFYCCEQGISPIKVFSGKGI